MSHDAHARPPEPIRALFKRWQRCSVQEIEDSDEIIDFVRHECKANPQIRKLANVSTNSLDLALQEFLSVSASYQSTSHLDEAAAYTIDALPGLYLYPSLLPHDVQVVLLNKLMHRDLSNPLHNSNLHLHYNIKYPDNCDGHSPDSLHQSFFKADKNAILEPKDPQIHKPLTVKQMLERKLRWITLGGQYDWTAKTYPLGPSPEFPEDIALLLKGMFPAVDAQAAIVNFYSPGDTLSVHRDVSEECDRGLISLSIGCDGLFVVGNDDGSSSATIRLRSGDVVLMSGESRFAWHAVPKILAGSCPNSLRDWPAADSHTSFENWKGWLSNKRINLNVRQMRACRDST